MSMLYKLPENAAEMFVITLLDHANNQFVDLAAFSFPTMKEANAAWNSVPDFPSTTNFLLDRHGKGGHYDDKNITAEWIEAKVGKPIQHIIRDGRNELTIYLNDMKDYLAKR